MATRRLGVGFIGSGFNAQFHMQSWRGVRDADVRGVWSPTPRNAAAAAALARRLDIGRARAFRSIADMVADPAIDAIWLAAPIRPASRMSRRFATPSSADAASCWASRARSRWPAR
jgi:predicted dehydrogenase